MDQSITLIFTIVPGTDNFPYPEIPHMFNVPLNSSTELESSTQSASLSTESELSTQSASLSTESELSTQSESSTESVETHVPFNTVLYDIENAYDSENDDNNTVWSLDFNAVDVSVDDDDNENVWSLDLNAVDVSEDDTVLSLDCNVVNIGNDDNVHNTVFGFDNHTFNRDLHITMPMTTMPIDNNEMDFES